MTTYAYIAAQVGSPEFQTHYNESILYASSHSLRGPLEVKYGSSHCSDKVSSVLATLIPDLTRADILLLPDCKVLGDTTVEIMTVLSALTKSGVRVHVINSGLRIEDNLTAMAVTMGCSLVTQIHSDLAHQHHATQSDLELTGDLQAPKLPHRTRKSSLDAMKDEIHSLVRSGATYADIARQIGANRQTVADFIVSRKLAC